MFRCALPVFPTGMEREMNFCVLFRDEVKSLKDSTLKITAFAFYRLYVNGEFVFFGPSRAPVGHARVDEIELGKYNREGNNEIVIEVAGYYCSSLATVLRTSFVCAELTVGGEVVLATGRDFKAYRQVNRVQKVERYSVQRHFSEVWDLTAGCPFDAKNELSISLIEDVPAYLPSTPHPYFGRVEADRYTSRGSFEDSGKDPERLNRYSWKSVEKEWGVFDECEIKHLPYRWQMRQIFTKTADGGSLGTSVSAGEYVMLDLGKLYAGFLNIKVKAKEDSDVYLAFSEHCPADSFEFSNINCQNVIEYIFGKSDEREVQTFEPYTCRYAVVMVRSGEIELSSFGITRYEFDMSRMIKRSFSDPELEAIYRAAERTFAHNAVDIYTDCPSRERAGWLCDSLFTSRAEYFLTGNTAIEDAFLENYRLYKPTRGLEAGMIPECYPGDMESIYIPQWAMWYMLEVYEYLTERNKRVDKELFRDSMYGLVDYFSRYENKEGMLENLPSWNFVEWSKANDWTQDLNYPTNFLYSEALERTGRLYGDESLINKADKVRARTIELSFNGEVFIDNAVRGEDGVLRNTENFSECGQIYAYLFGKLDMDSEKYRGLKAKMLDSFSHMSGNEENFTHVDIMPGFYLKMWAYSKLGEIDKLSALIKDFFGTMIDLTDTLWEYKPVRRKGSYDHGFASYAAVFADMCDKTK